MKPVASISHLKFLLRSSLGFTVPHGFIVHHIDQDPTNQDVRNLMAMTPTEHKRLHNILRKHPELKGNRSWVVNALKGIRENPDFGVEGANGNRKTVGWKQQRRKDGTLLSK